MNRAGFRQLWLTAPLVGVLLAAVLLIGHSVIYDRITQGIIDSQIAGEVAALRSAEDPQALLARWGEMPASLHRVAALLSAEGKLLFGPSWPLNLPMVEGWHITEGGGRFEWRDSSFFVARLPGGELLAVGYELAGFEAVLDVLLVQALLLVLLLSLLGGVIAWAVGQRLDRRVSGVKTQITRVMSGELDQRLPTGRDPLGQLSAQINHMLDRLQAMMAEIQGNADVLAHELRTPLTRVANCLDRQDIDAARESLNDALTLFASLLQLSRLTAGQIPGFPFMLDLGPELADLGESYRLVAAEAGRELRMDLQKTPPVLGDRSLILQAVINLLENALKYSSAGSGLTLSLRAKADSVEIAIVDQGPGIPDCKINRAFDRFQRLGREMAAPGFGLGLPIAQAIALLHGGEIRLRNLTPGFEATLRLPYATALTGAAFANCASNAASPLAQS